MKRKSSELQPVTFKHQNKVLTKPSSMNDDECEDLPICNVDDMCISKWRISFWQRIKLIFSGHVWLGIHSGHTQPPVWLVTKSPLKQ